MGVLGATLREILSPRLAITDLDLVIFAMTARDMGSLFSSFGIDVNYDDKRVRTCGRTDTEDYAYK